MAAPGIAVIIPYYQRETGVLRRALASVAAQEGCTGPVDVIVVDDASPVPAAGEVAAVAFPAGTTVRVIAQANGGPGPARNAGLDAVRPGTRYVAFLDSDDEWSPDHLARATLALGQGYDFYFADLLQLGADVSAFRRAGRIRPAEHPALDGAPDLHAYQGDLFDQILRGNVIGTPTVVYDFERLGRHRFKVEFTNFGEDYLFWMDLALDRARAAFSAQTEVVCGRGVNVYVSAGWGDERHLLRVHNEIKFRRLLLDAYPLNDLQRAHVRATLSGLRLAFARDLLRRLRHGHPLPVGLLGEHWKLDPSTYLTLPLNTMRVVLGNLS